MKKNLLFLMILISSLSFSQNLTLSELLTIKKMDLENIELFLTKKGWVFKGGEPPTKELYGVARFVYGSTGDFNYGESFLAIFYPTIGEKRISIQISKQTKYSEYINSIKKFQTTLIKNEIRDDNMIKVYQGATTSFEFTTTTSKNKFGDENPSWELFIINNNDYWDNYNE